MMLVPLMISCTTTKEIKIDVPEFPTLPDTSLIVEDRENGTVTMPTFYWRKIASYIADAEMCFELIQEFDKDTLID